MLLDQFGRPIRLESDQPSENPTSPVEPADTAAVESVFTDRNPLPVSQVPPAPPNQPQTQNGAGNTTPPWKKRLETVAVITGLLILLVNTFQSCEAKRSADATIDAVRITRQGQDDSTVSQGDTLIQMQAQSRAMRESANAATTAANASKNQASDTKVIASQALIQTQVSQRMAGLTQDTLSISNRAYVNISKVTVNSEDGTAAIIWVQNSGRIPSKPFGIRVQMTATPTEGRPIPLEAPQSFRYGGNETIIPPGDYPIPLRLPDSYARYSKAVTADQAFFTLDLEVVYGIGFDVEGTDSPRLDHYRNCFMYATRYQPKPDWYPCSSNVINNFAAYKGTLNPFSFVDSIFEDYEKQQRAQKPQPVTPPPAKR